MMLVPNVAADDIAVDRSTLPDRAANLLREQILLEKLKPGEILAERQLALKLGVSRTPLRDALKILATEGLVEIIPNLRPRVANPSLEQLLDLVDVLASLERLAGELAAVTMSNETISELKDITSKMRTIPKDGNEMDFFKLDMSFHSAIVRSTKNAPLVKTHHQYNSALFRARFMSTRWVDRRPLMHDQHDEVIEMLGEHKSKETGMILFSHLMQLEKNLTDIYKPEG